MNAPQAAWEAAHGLLEPMTKQERADFAAELRAARAAQEGEDTADLFRLAEVARSAGC